MARIRSIDGFHATRLWIAGRLTASDMGRLERACAQVLATNPMRLEIDMTRVTFVDATARAVLEQMMRRGAVVTAVNPSSSPQRSVRSITNGTDDDGTPHASG